MGHCCLHELSLLCMISYHTYEASSRSVDYHHIPMHPAMLSLMPSISPNQLMHVIKLVKGRHAVSRWSINNNEQLTCIYITVFIFSL